MSDLEEAERARLREMVEQLRRDGPDAYQFVKDLHELGMVPGWRCLRRVGPENNKENS